MTRGIARSKGIAFFPSPPTANFPAEALAACPARLVWVMSSSMSTTKRFRPGVLFGDEVKELLDYAKANQSPFPRSIASGPTP